MAHHQGQLAATPGSSHLDATGVESRCYRQQQWILEIAECCNFEKNNLDGLDVILALWHRVFKNGFSEMKQHSILPGVLGN